MTFPHKTRVGPLTLPDPPSIVTPSPWRRRRGIRRRRRASLGTYVRDHLARKRAGRASSLRWLACVELHLQEAVEYFGAETWLHRIAPRDVERYAAHLLARSNGRGGILAVGTVRHYLNSLSNLFRRARRDGYVRGNPVTAAMDRPQAVRVHAPWLEPFEVAAVLDIARRYEPQRADRAMGFLFELVATFAYTGMRKSEGLGLEVHDIDLERGLIHVRPNAWRALKNGESERSVPLFSELRVILHAYLNGPRAPTGRLLFPSPHGFAGEHPLRNLRRTFGQLPMPERLSHVARPVTGDATPLRMGTRILRHSYCAARLQTLDWGRPIAPFTVAREMGHTDLDMVLRIYGHLGQIRCPRSAEVSFLPARR